MIKKVSVLVFALLISAIALFSQNTVTVCNGFETATDRAEWTLVNGSQTNQWVMNTATNNGGSYSLYVTNAPTGSVPAHSYTNTSTYVWAYKDIEFPECDNDFVLSFDWIAYGESCCDYMYVYIGAPAAVTAGSSTAPTGATQLNNPTTSSVKFNVASAWQHFETTLNNATYSGQVMRLYFMWHNDGSVQTMPPAAVDNVCIQSCEPCNQPVVNITPATAVLCQGESVNLTATVSGGSGQGYTYAWTPTTGLSSTNTASTTATPSTTTTYALRVTDSEDCAKTVRVTVEISGTTLSISQSPQVYCRGSEPVTLNANLNVSGSCSNYTYRWSNGPTSAVSTDVPQQNTTYTVTATPVGGDCCTLTATHTVQVGDCNQNCNDFESTQLRAEWTLVNGSETNQWVMNTGTSNGGVYSLYVTNSPTSSAPANTYTNTTSSVWAYCDIEFPECDDDYVLSFDWKCGGESSCDYMGVWIGAPATVTAGSTTAPSGATRLSNPNPNNSSYATYFNTYGNYNGDWHHTEITLANATYSGQIMRLYLLWHNDGSVQNYCPAAVDNVCILSCTPCDQPVVNVTPTSAVLCQGESVTFNATVTGGSGHGYTYEWTPAAGLSSTNTANTTATPTATTTYSLRVTDSEDCAKTVRVPVEISGTTLSITQSPQVYCRGSEPVTLNADLNVNGSCSNYTYQWSNGPTSAVSTDVPQQNTTYTVTATPVGGDCCTLTATHTVEVGDCNQDCSDFETPTSRSEWTLVNGSQTNQWVMSTGTNNGGQYSLYVSSDPNSAVPSNAYANTASYVWAYKDIEFPECDEDFVLSFDWKCGGESSLDYMAVFIGPEATVTAGSATAPAGSVQLQNPNPYSATYANYFNTYGNYNGDWHHTEIILDNEEYSGMYMRLYFMWKNDGSVQNYCPAAVDNVCLQACIPCNQPVVTVTPASVILCQGESATFTASATGGSGTGYTYTWTPAESLDVSTGPTVTASPQRTTTYRVRVEDSEGCAKTVRVNAEIAGTRLNVTANPAGFCVGQNQTVTVTAALTVEGSCSSYTYLWSTGATGTTISVSPDVTTEYTVTATPADPACCELIASGIVAVMDCSADGCPSVTPAELGTNNPEIELDCNSQIEGVTLCANVLATAVEADDYFVFSIPYNPPYGYTDGNRIFANASDDTWSEVVNLPFTFCYYGNTYTQVVAGANSVATFNTSVAGNSCAWSFDESIPDANLFPNTIFACYRDIYPSTSDYVASTGDGGIFEGVLGEYPCRSYKLSFNNIKLFSCTEVRTFSSMIVFYEGTNIIDIYLRDAPTCSSWNDGNGVIGLQNSDCTMGITPPGRNTGAWTAHEEAWRFMPTGQPSYDVTWYLGTDTSATTGTILGTGDLLTVMPEQTTYYTARLQYTACNGDYFDIINTCHVTVNNETPELDVRVSEDTICPQQQVTVSAITTDALTYQWNTGDTTASFTLVPDSMVTTFVCTTTYENGCIRTDSATVYAAAVLEPPTFTVEPAEICAGERSTISVDLEYAHYHWSTGSQNPTITVTPANTTTYHLTVTDEIGCAAEGETQVIVHPVPTASFRPEQYLTFLDDGQANVHFINYSSGAETFLWDFHDPYGNSASTERDPDHTYTHPGIYRVYLWVASDFGCADSTYQEVSIQNPFYFYVPNSFSPDGDGLNELWQPVGTGVMEDNYECTVYDRWGRVVFHTNSLYQPWDGTEKGKELPVGSYVYFIRAYTMDLIPKEFLGTVTILK